MNACRQGVWALLALFVLAAGPVQAQTVVEYIHTDALGSVVAVTDANRNVIERREYEPYGAQLAPTVQDGPGYTGHVQDAATGLVYMQQRYYDPLIGRFLSVDPVTAYEKPFTNFNRYVYTLNNPYKFTDPDGRDAAALGWGMVRGGLIATQADSPAPGPADAIGLTVAGIGLIIVGGNALYNHVLNEAAQPDTSTSAADKIKEGAAPSDGPKYNGDINSGGDAAAQKAWDGIQGTGETKTYTDSNGNVKAEVKSLADGGVAEKHISTKSDHAGSATIKIQDADKNVIQTTRYVDKK